MVLISPEVLAAARGLSLGACSFLILVGGLLWVLGWRWHRFWLVFVITTTAGIIGLNAGRASGGYVLVIGLLLAFAGGVMALELAKIGSFAAGGVGAWLTIQNILPQAQEMWAIFLAGGLMGVILHRLWTMLLTSLAGVLLIMHAGMLLLEQVGFGGPMRMLGTNAAAVNGVAVMLIVLGLFIQARTAEQGAAAVVVAEVEKPAEEVDEGKKPKKKRKKKKDDEENDEEDEAEAEGKETAEPPAKRSWFGRGKSTAA
ncbi:MAG: hypothetical protein ACRCZF_18500 [Gemmataceae bacterium]